MKRRNTAAGGITLAAFLIILAVGGSALAGGYIQVQQTVVPDEVYLAGSGGSPETATLTLTLTGTGPRGRFPIDCMLVIDVSATAQIDVAKEAAFGILSKFKEGDRAGVVAFATEAHLIVPLTDDLTRVKQAISDLSRGGKSAFGDALKLARQQLTSEGRPDAVLAEVLLTDGQSNSGSDPAIEGKMAKELGIKLISIGIGNLIDRNLLEQFASETGGLFLPRPRDDAPERIMARLAVTSAGGEITVKKILPAGISYAGGDPTPTQIDQGADGMTVLTWRVGSLGLGARWTATVLLKGTKVGEWATDAESVVTMDDFRGVPTTINISPLTLRVIAPNAAPIAAFTYGPEEPSTSEAVSFTDESSDSDGKVVAWKWDFGDGEESEAQNPEHRFAAPGTYTVSLIAIDDRGARSAPAKVEITIKNTPPTALFTCSPKEPRSGVEAVFDASGSNDIDGHVVTYSWDFDGDGAFDKTTSNPQVSYTFPSSGEVQVTLAVTDDSGGTDTYTKAIEVLPSVTAVRTIDTCLPDDVTISGGTVTVTVTITANTEVHGLTLHEEIPAGWTFTPVDNGSATLREASHDWLFMETLKDGDQRAVVYTLTAPTTPLSDHGQEQVSLTGNVGSSSPRLSQMVLGEDKVARVDTLPVLVVISRWDTEKNAIDLCLPPQVGFDQIQYAVSLWISGDEVPYTNGATIDLATMQDLIAYWLTDTSVHDPLP